MTTTMPLGVGLMVSMTRLLLLLGLTHAVAALWSDSTTLWHSLAWVLGLTLCMGAILVLMLSWMCRAALVETSNTMVDMPDGDLVLCPDYRDLPLRNRIDCVASMTWHQLRQPVQFELSRWGALRRADAAPDIRPNT